MRISRACPDRRAVSRTGDTEATVDNSLPMKRDYYYKIVEAGFRCAPSSDTSGSGSPRYDGTDVSDPTD